MPLPHFSVGLRRMTVPVVLSAALLALAACSSSSSSTSTGTAAARLCSKIPAGPINVYNILPLSGPTATSGILIEDTAVPAAAYMNAHGGICGHQIAVHNLNDKGDPATSLGLARQLVASGATIVMQDSFGSAEDAIHPYLMQHKVLIINGNGAYSLYNPEQNPYSYSVGPSNQEYAAVMVNWAASHHYNDVGFLTDGSSYGQELTADALADVRADGLKYIKTVTYSPTSLDLAPQVQELRQAGVQTVFPTGFTAVPQIVQAIKQSGWSPHLVGWGGMAVFGVTQSEVPPGTVDSCQYHYTPGRPTSTFLTPTITALLKKEVALTGVSPSDFGIIGVYEMFQALAHAVEVANSLSGPALAAALGSTSNLPTVVPGLDLTWHANQVHNGFPQSDLVECTMQTGPYDIRYAAAG